MAAKSDMETLGVFSEPGHTTIGDKYPKQHVSFVPINVNAGKGKQFANPFPKERAANQDGYFEDTFKRIYEKEAYSDIIRMRRLHRLKERQRSIAGHFIPTTAEKTLNGTAMFNGTFSGPVAAFSPVTRPRPARQSLGRNFLNNPGQKGGGNAYVGLTIGPEPLHKDEKYSRSKDLYRQFLKTHAAKVRSGPFKLNMHPQAVFTKNPYGSDRPLGPPKSGGKKKRVGPPGQPFVPSSPGKAMGGAKFGAFTEYPTHSVDPYRKSRGYRAPKRDGNVFLPNQGIKSRPIKSVVNMNVTRSTNEKNYRTIRKVMAY